MLAGRVHRSGLLSFILDLMGRVRLCLGEDGMGSYVPYHYLGVIYTLLWLRRRLLLGSFAFVFILDWRLEPKRANLALSESPS